MTEDQKPKKMYRREEDLKELQDKFNKFISDLASDRITGYDLPEIIEKINNQSNFRNKMSKITLRYKLSLLLAIVIILIAIPYPSQLKSVGRVVPENRTIIKAPYDGILKGLNFKYGEAVKKGDLICEVYNEKYILEGNSKKERLNTISQHINAINKLEEDMENMLTRKKELYKQRLISSMEIDQLQLEKDKTRIRYMETLRESAALEENVKLLEELIRESKIISPINGIFMTPNVTDKENQFIQKGERICEVANANSFIIQMDIKEKDIPKIKIGQSVKVKFSIYPDKIFRGHIKMIGYYVSDSLSSRGKSVQPSERDYYLVTMDTRPVKTLSVDIKIDDMPKDIKYGMDAKIFVPYKMRILELLLGWKI